jgi:hypothetical protein
MKQRGLKQACSSCGGSRPRPGSIQRPTKPRR